MPDAVHMVVSVALEDAGEATRALALARALRRHRPAGHDIRIEFLSCGSRFEPMVEAAGFPVVPAEPRVEGRSIADDLQWDLPELVGSESLGREFIEGQLAALRRLEPDVVLHGMWPFASLAARMLGIPTVAFLPLPLNRECVGSGLLHDLPDPVPVLPRLPRPVRKGLARAGGRLMTRAPIFRQHRLGAAAAACGWPVNGALSLFDAVRADLTLVTDLPDYYTDLPLPADFAVTGPVFAADDDATHDGTHDGAHDGAARPERGGDDARLDPRIAELMRDGGRPAVLLTMGSSGTPPLLFEAIRALRPGTSGTDDWNVLVLASPSVCDVAEARAVAGDDPRILVTERFVPGPAVNALADVVVAHGGQGTVQTAIAAGTPVVGVGLQMEQQINLDHVMDAGAGIRIQAHRWHAPVIRDAVRAVLDDPSYRAHAAVLALEMRAIDGPRTAADRMWEFLLSPAA